VLHSLSPRLFAAAWAAGPTSGWYTRLASERAEEALQLARALELHGLNVTAPFKEPMLHLVDHVEPSAALVGAVNTVFFRQGETWGANTDPAGVRALLQAGALEQGRPAGELANKAIVLGAGGATRAALVALREAKVKDVVVLNRTLDRAALLAEEFACRAGPFPDYAGELPGADVVISCLPGGVPLPEQLNLNPKALVLDASYAGSTMAQRAARAGCTYLDGRQWLVGQAIESFSIFCNQSTTTAAMAQGLAEPWPHKEPDAGQRVVLAGLMGTGKSTIGRLIAHELGQPFRDIDSEIERRAGKKIHEIFATSGEEAFRQLEADVTAEALGHQAGVIALGGGALQNAQTCALARHQATVVWLWTAPSVCAARTAGSTRPLLAQGSPEQTLTRLLDQRQAVYGQAADLVVNTEGPSAEKTAQRISYEIKHIRATRPANKVADSEGEK
jgi:shikimate dehydrogenase